MKSSEQMTKSVRVTMMEEEAVRLFREIQDLRRALSPTKSSRFDLDYPTVDTLQSMLPDSLDED